ncbi:biotin carboxyl carrier protein of acetyl-CoA carboxylase [alpha proteobacterium U9-1i]|nr:biotin carboxyl carrier protein of acetyl-CoA carboxylase [alpha proteobacterium U9-1i]
MSEKKPTNGVDPALVRELAAILSDTGLSEIEVEHGELRLRLARTITAAPVMHHVTAAPVAHAPPSAAAPPPAAAPPADAGKAAAAHPGMVPSPMVGTAYLSPEPGAPVFVKIGDTVTEGQTVLVVEAMKTFNPIPAPRAGKVTAILVTDAQPVEFGEPLLIIE